MSGRRRVDCAGTAERSYTVERKPTPRSRSGSCLRPTTSILEPMEGGVARTKCLRADTAIRTRVHGASNNFGNGYRSYCLTRQSTLADQSASKRRWKTNAEAVVFYFELARLPNSDLRDPLKPSERLRVKLYAKPLRA